MIELLPAAQAVVDAEKTNQPLPDLQPAAFPAEVGPEGGINVPDLRAVLLELTIQRGQLRGWVVSKGLGPPGGSP